MPAIDDLKAAGFSDDEVTKFATEKRAALLSGGFSHQEADDYLGQSTMPTAAQGNKSLARTLGDAFTRATSAVKTMATGMSTGGGEPAQAAPAAPTAPEHMDEPGAGEKMLQTTKDIGTVYGPIEGVLNATTGLLFGFPAQIVGAIGGLTNKYLLNGKADPAEVAAAAQKIFTYQPFSEPGKRIAGNLALPFVWTAKAGEAVGHEIVDQGVKRNWNSDVTAAAAAVTDNTIQMLTPALALSLARRTAGYSPTAEDTHNVAKVIAEEAAPPTGTGKAELKLTGTAADDATAARLQAENDARPAPTTEAVSNVEASLRNVYDKLGIDPLTVNDVAKQHPEIIPELLAAGDGIPRKLALEAGIEQPETLSPVYRDVVDGLAAIEHGTPEYRHNAGLLNYSFFESMAKRTGVPIDTLWRKYRPELTDRQPGEAALAQGPKTALDIQQEVMNEHPKVNIGLTEHPSGLITVDAFELRNMAADEGKGYGPEAMKALTAQADAAGKPLMLIATPAKGSARSLNDLVRFYEKNGFYKESEQPYTNAFIMSRDAKETQTTQEGPRAGEPAGAAPGAGGDPRAQAGQAPAGNALSNTLFQGEKKPTGWYYSELGRQIEARGSLKASPEQWKSTIANLKGVKADEIKWSGIEDWLELQKAAGEKVTKEQVLDFLRANGVQVKEVMLGGAEGKGESAASARMLEIGQRIGDLQRQMESMGENADPFEARALHSEIAELEQESFEIEARAERAGEATRQAGEIAQQLAHEGWEVMDDFHLTFEATDMNAPLRGIPMTIEQMREEPRVPARILELAAEFERAHEHETADLDDAGRQLEGLEERLTNDGYAPVWDDQGDLSGVQTADGRRYWLHSQDDMTALPGNVRNALMDLFAMNDQANAGTLPASPTKFQQYVLPGGRNYRELLLTLPEKEPAVKPLTELPPGFSIRPLNGGDRAQWTLVGPDGIGTRLLAATVGDARVEALQRFNDRTTAPDERAQTFNSSHFDQPNILAHIRFDDRTDAAGKSVLFIEEFQSDWAQQGKKRGFAEPAKAPPSIDELKAQYGWQIRKSPETIEEWRLQRPDGTFERQRFHSEEALRAEHDAQTGRTVESSGYEPYVIRGPAPDAWEITFNDGSRAYYRTEEIANGELLREWEKDQPSQDSKTPRAPFVEKTEAWVTLAAKRMIRYAAEHGYDSIAWTTGEQQVSRYTSALRKAVDAIEWTKTDKGVQLVGYKGKDNANGVSFQERSRLEEIANDARREARSAIRANDNLGFDSASEAMEAVWRHRTDWTARWGDLPIEAIASIQTFIDRHADYLKAEKTMTTRQKVVDTTEKEDALSDAIGKAMAEKIISDPAQTGTIEGNDIHISDTGMAAFYDKIVPNIVNKVLKQLGGGKVGEINFKPAERQTIDLNAAADQRPNFRTMDEADLESMTGAEEFADGQAPMLAEHQLLVDGELSDVIVSVDKSGVHFLVGEGDNELFVPAEWFVGKYGTGRGTDLWNTRAGAMRAVKDAWEETGQGSMWFEAEHIIGDANIAQPRGAPAGWATADTGTESTNRTVGEQHGFEVTPAMRDKVMGGLPLFQGGPERPRGYLQKGPAGERTMGLLAEADPSTYVHESGHFFLDVMADLARGEHAPADIAQDMQRLYNWMGVKDAEAWHSMTLEEQRPMHEKFARAFERYLAEGKAPAPRLQAMFDRFKAWMLDVYKSLKNMGVKINDETRGVMDRMLAGEPIADLKNPKAELDPWLEDQPAAPAKPLPMSQGLDSPDMRSVLEQMAEHEAGWSQIGGKLDTGRLRDAGGVDEQGNVTKLGTPAFTEWIPKAEWWPGKPKGATEAKVKLAVQKALAGEPLKALEQRIVDYMMDVANERLAHVNELGEDVWASAAHEIVAEGLEPTTENVVDADAVARAVEKNADAVEAAATQHADNDAAFMAEIRRINGDEKPSAGAAGGRDQAGRAAQGGSQTAGEAGSEGGRQPARGPETPGTLDVSGPTADELATEGSAPKIVNMNLGISPAEALAAVRDSYTPYVGVEMTKFPSSPIVDAIWKVIAPGSRGPIAKRQAGIMRHNFGDQAHEREIAIEKLKGFAAEFDRNTKAENYEFIDAMEHGTALANPKWAPAAKALRELLDAKRQQVQDLGKGQLENFIENYFPHIWKDNTQAVQFYGRRPLTGGASFLKQRLFDDFKDGLRWRAYGEDGFIASFDTKAEAEAAAPEGGGVAGPLTPITDNPVELALLKTREMDRYIYGQKIFQEMKDAKLAKFVGFGKKPPAGWVKINDKVARVFQPNEGEGGGMILRGEYYAPDEAGTLINNHLTPGLQGHGAFDAWRKIGGMMNSAQLGLSLFHVGFTTMDSMVSKIALGVKEMARGDVLAGAVDVAQGINPAQPFLNLYKGDKLLRAYLGHLDNPELAPIVDALIEAGARVRMDDIYRNASINAFKQGLRQGGTGGNLQAAKELIPTILDRINAPIFEHLVPRQKLGVFFDMAKDYLERNPASTLEERRAAMGEMWDSVDNRMGLLVYDNVFWNRVLKDGLMASVRSVGWNLGTFRELGGGAIDALNVKGIIKRKGITDRTAYVVALPLITAVYGAMIQYLYTGEPPRESKDYFYPRTGRLRPDGTEDRVTLPTYMKDVYAYAEDISNFVKYGTDPTQTLKNKAHPLIATISQMLANEDFFGANIRNPSSPLVEQALDEAKYLGKQMEPFSLRNYQQQAKQRGVDPSVLDYITSPSMFGVTPAPGYIVKNDAENESSAVSRLREPLMARYRQELKDGAKFDDVIPKMIRSGLSRRDIQYVLRSSGDTPLPHRLKSFGRDNEPAAGNEETDQ